MNKKIIINNDFTTHFKLEFDIKTDCKNMPIILDEIVNIMSEKFNDIDDKTEITVTPTLTNVTMKAAEEQARRKWAKRKTYGGI